MEIEGNIDFLHFPYRAKVQGENYGSPSIARKVSEAIVSLVTKHGDTLSEASVHPRISKVDYKK